MFRVIIAGGRDFDNYPGLCQRMDKLLANVSGEIIINCGKARGADTLGERYAKERGYKVRYFPADWDLHGKKAGFLRNEEMARNADALVAFWDGRSRGTKHMIDIATRMKLRVRVEHYRKVPVKKE